MITKEQATEYLKSQGVELPDFVVDLILSQMSDVDACLTSNYSQSAADLIRLLLLLLLAIEHSNAYITSQRAPSGAAQTKQFRDINEKWKATYLSLRKMDSKGCTSSLLPPDPTTEFFGGLWTARGSRPCE